MWLERLRRYLLPTTAERDAVFRESVERASQLGLRVIAGVSVFMAIIMSVARFVLSPDPETWTLRLLQAGCLLLLGVMSFALSRMPGILPYARRSAIAIGLGVALVLIWFSLLMTRFDASADDFVPGEMTLVLLVLVATLPLRPTDTLFFGLIIEFLYVVLTLTAQAVHQVPTGVDSMFGLVIFLLALLSTALSTVLYGQRLASWDWHLQTLRAADDLRQAEARNLLAQNAASVGRLAAALSHELNSPVGALVSGVESLLLLSSRQATAKPEEQPRFVVLQNDLRKSIKLSTDRLKDIVARMQRFTNLDKAEVQSANINQLLNDVAALLEPQYRDRATLKLDLSPVPDLICRPQQLSAVFSSLLMNSVEAVNGNGRVIVTTSAIEADVHISFCDNGRGLEASELSGIFDPGFKVSGNRVSTGNWGLFSSRQIIQEHGGDINIESKIGDGTCVRIVLPCTGCGEGLQSLT